MKTFCLFIAFSLVSFAGFAQTGLTLEDAMREALLNNYDIRLIRNQATIAAGNVTPGNAGFLPTLSFAGSGTLSSTNLNQKFASGLEVNRNGAGSTAIAGTIQLDWTLFDGMKMFTTMDKLKELDTLSQETLRTKMQNTCAEVAMAYYSILRYQNQAVNTGEIISLFEERLRIATSRLDIGSGTKLEVSQAKVDLNAQKSALITQLSNAEQQKVMLNRLMGRSPDAAITLSADTKPLYVPTLEALRSKALQQNQDLMAARRNVSIQSLAWKEVRSGMAPTISLSAGSNLGITRNEAGFLLSNQSLGMYAGLSASWTLFDGFNQRRLSQNAELNLAGARLNYESMKLSIDAEIMVAWKALERAREIAELENATFILAKDNANIAIESFRLGKISSIEMKAAQESLASTSIRLTEAEYQARIAETTLLRLTGEWLR